MTGYDLWQVEWWLNEEILTGSRRFLFFLLNGFCFIPSFHPRTKLPQGDGDWFNFLTFYSAGWEEDWNPGRLEPCGDLGSRVFQLQAMVKSGEPWWTMVKLLDLRPLSFYVMMAASSDIQCIPRYFREISAGPRLTHGSWRTSTPKWISWRKSWEIPRPDSMISHGGGCGGYNGEYW